MIIRAATVSDAAALSALHAGSFEDGWSEADFATWLSRTEAFACVVEVDAKLHALGLALEAGADAELLTIATAPQTRRAGLGRRIFQALNIEARNRALERWVLEVANNNLPAIQLYKTSGFMEIGLRKAYYNTRNGRVDALVMARKVGPGGGQNDA